MSRDTLYQLLRSHLAYLKLTVAADLAVHAMLESVISPPLEAIGHGGQLPELPSSRINLYRARTALGEPVDALADMVRGSYRGIAVAA